MGSLAIFMIFIMASGLSPNIGAQIAFRFLAGFFGSTPLTCAGGTVSDLWNPLGKTFGFPLFAISGFGGPVLGPVIGSYIGTGDLPSWRWTEWITLITAGLVLSLIVLFQPETNPLVLLSWKAHHLRQLTDDDRYRAQMEITKSTLWYRLRISLSRPFILTANELIIILMALYLTTIYIVLFTFLTGYTFLFSDVYGTSQGLTNVLFVGMLVGILLAMGLVPLVYSWTKKDMAERHGQIRPECRLWYSMLGGAPAIPIALFWIGWTDYVSNFPSSPSSRCHLSNKRIIIVINQHLVSTYCNHLIRLRRHLHLPQRVHVYHRLLRDLRGIGPHFSGTHPLFGSWRYDGRGYTVLQEYGYTLDSHYPGLHQYSARPDSVSALQIRPDYSKS